MAYPRIYFGEPNDSLEADIYNGRLDIRCEDFAGSYDSPANSASFDMTLDEARQFAEWILASIPPQ